MHAALAFFWTMPLDGMFNEILTCSIEILKFQNEFWNLKKILDP